MNPFARSIHDPATDSLAVTSDDATDLPMVAITLSVETGGTVVFDTVSGETRTLSVADFSILRWASSVFGSPEPPLGAFIHWC